MQTSSSKQSTKATEGGMTLAQHRRQQLSLADDVRAWLSKAGEEDVFEIFADLRERPKWYHRDKVKPLQKAELMETNEHGYCYLDSTTMWDEFPMVTRKLAQSGERLTKADLLQKGPEGRTFLEEAARSGAFAEVVKELARHNEELYSADMLMDGQPNAILKAAVAWGQHVALFEQQSWAGRRAAEVRTLAAAIPESARSEIRNLHMLTFRLRNEEHHAEHGTGP